MNIIKPIIISALGVFGLASGCAVDSDIAAEDVSSGEDAVCWNEAGTNAAMASLAVATAMELRRWQPRTDFYVASDWTLQLTSTGKSRCADWTCKNVQTILDWQKPIYAGKIRFAGGDYLAPDVFQSRLLARFDAQRVCDSRPSNQSGNCSAEPHDLEFKSAGPGACDTNYYFHAFKAGTRTNLSYPWNLRNQLLWVGWDFSEAGRNPYLAFSANGDDIQIDPTAGVITNDPQASGSCPAVCNKISTTNVSNNCCVCNGVQGKLQYTVAPPAGSQYMFSCR